MSKSIQRRAAQRRDNARERETRARERAEDNRDRGDGMLARRHEASADRQAASAAVAEALRLADVAIEGDQLGEEAERHESAAD